MSLKEAIRLALLAINAHKLRSILTTLGVMIGVLTVIGMLALIDGLNTTVHSQLSSIGSTTLYVQKFSWVMNHDEFLKARSRKNITIDDADAIRDKIQGILRVAPILSTSMTLKSGSNVLEAVELHGTTPEYLYIADFSILSGRPLTEIDVRQRRQSVMVGATIVKILFGGRDPVGKSILIGPYHFDIIAQLGTKGSLFGNDQDNMVLIPITTYSKLYSGPISERGPFTGSVTIAVQPQSEEVSAQIKDNIRGLLRQRRQVQPEKPDDFSINTAEQLLQTYKMITNGIYGLMIGVTILSLVVGGIGIMNIMLVSVSERIREIGIRKAVGARKRDIKSQFLIEAMVLSCAGGGIGTILGFLVAWGISQIIHLPAAVSFWSVLLGFGFSVFVGVFFGWYPASRAANMSPIEALRYE
jgi:putative ABC transport system permease protein